MCNSNAFFQVFDFAIGSPQTFFDSFEIDGCTVVNKDEGIFYMFCKNKKNKHLRSLFFYRKHVLFKIL